MAQSQWAKWFKMKKLKHALSSSLYYSPVYPHVIHSFQTWGSTNHTQLGRLKRLLDWCLKTLRSAQANNSYSQRKIMNSDNTYKYFSLIRIFKYMNVGEVPYSKQNFSSNQSCHKHNTRLSTNLNINHPTVDSSKVFQIFLL